MTNCMILSRKLYCLIWRFCTDLLLFFCDELNFSYLYTFRQLIGCFHYYFLFRDAVKQGILPLLLKLLQRTDVDYGVMCEAAWVVTYLASTYVFPNVK